METFTRFLYEFLAQFFEGLRIIFNGLWKGISQLANIKAYMDVISKYKGDLSMPEWLMAGIAILAMILVYGMAIVLVALLVKKYLKIRKKAIEQESLLDEIATLNNKVGTLMKEKDEILAMKVSQLGLKPNESAKEEPEEKKPEEDVNTGIRFSKLNEIDQEYANYKIKNYGNNFTLPELCENFRNFAASRLHLYYTTHMMQLFISALASTKLVILQGISGTGKTSLGKILET